MTFTKKAEIEGRYILNAFQRRFHSIIPTADSSRISEKRILHYTLTEETSDNDELPSNDHIESGLSSIVSFIQRLNSNDVGYSIILGDNLKESVSSEFLTLIESECIDKHLWTLSDYFGLDEADYYDPAISGSLILLNYRTSDAKIIEDCTYLLNHCWGIDSEIIYISIIYDRDNPVLYYYNYNNAEGCNPANRLFNQVQTCIKSLEISKSFPEFKQSVINEKIYLLEECSSNFYAPIPHLYFNEVSTREVEAIKERPKLRLAPYNWPYSKTIIEYLELIKTYYNSVHIFIVDKYNESQNLKDITSFDDIINYFRNRSGYTVDCLDDLYIEYGAPKYWNAYDDLFVVLNYLSTPYSLSSQSTPLLNWMDSTPPCVSDIYNSLFISVYAEIPSKLNHPGVQENADNTSTIRRLVSKWENNRSNTPFKYYCNYYPKRFLAPSEEDANNRSMIWSFKDGIKHSKFCAFYKWIKQLLTETFLDYLNEITFLCIPASTEAKYIRRFKSFSKDLCEELGMINAFDYLAYLHDGEAKHTV